MGKRILLIIFMGLLMSGGLGYVERVRVFRAATAVLPKIGFAPIPARAAEVTFLSGNLQLRGTLYTPGTFIFRFPTIVICHGGAKLGRRLAMYVVLAQALARRGYVVLTFDFRGYGDSEHPRRFRTFADLDFTRDVTSALTFLATLKAVDPARLYLVGHSFGAGVAVAAGIREGRVKKIVSICPGRRTNELYFGKAALNPDIPRLRLSEEMKISPPLSKEILYPHMIDYIADAALDYPVHPPILLIDGEDESSADLAYLKKVYDQMTAPKGYVTIRDADHYFGTRRDQDSPAGAIPYKEPVMNELVEAIDRWFREQ